MFITVLVKILSLILSFDLKMFFQSHEPVREPTKVCLCVNYDLFHIYIHTCIHDIYISLLTTVNRLD